MLKRYLFLLSFLYLIGIVSCKKFVSDETPTTEETTPTPNPTPAPDLGILTNDGYTYFDVPISVPCQTFKAVVDGGEGLNKAITPSGDYGIHQLIDFRLNGDDDIDVFWQSGTNKTGSTPNRNLARISLTSKTITKMFKIPDDANLPTTRFLGFDGIGNDEFVMGYTSQTVQESDPLIPTKLLSDVAKQTYFTRFDGNTGMPVYTTPLFTGDYDAERGAGWDGPGIVRYNKAKGLVGVYFSFRGGAKITWRTGHQGGFVAFFGVNDGKFLTYKRGPEYKLPDFVPNPVIGRDWYGSHNFDHRLMVASDNTFYTLLHGDAFPRSLQFDKWDPSLVDKAQVLGGQGLQYFKIPGNEGDNSTKTKTGDFVELPNGNIAISYVTSVDRTAQNLKVVLISKTAPNAFAVSKETWVTNDNVIVGWGAKIANYGTDKILVGWNNFKDAVTPLNTSFALLDLNGNLVSAPEVLPTAGCFLYPTQSIARTSTGKLIFVSAAGDDNTKLRVHIITPKK